MVRVIRGWYKKATAFLLPILVSLLLLAPPCALEEAHAGIDEGVAYILANQGADGGFREPGKGEVGQDATTAWCVMALAAAGIDVRGVKRNGKSPLDFLATQSCNWRSVTDYERTLLAVAAAGEDPRSFGGVDLLARVRSYQGAGGNIGEAVNSNAFGILAYRAVAEPVPEGAVTWHRRVQNPDGGWGNSPGAASNPDMTAASIMALRAAGAEAGDPSITAALSYLRTIQNQDGGFSFQPGTSDTAATSWCAQAILAAGQDPGGSAWSKGGNTPISFIRSTQAADGGFSWMKGRSMNPVWTTSYAVCALAGKPYPVAVFQPPRPSAEGGGQDSVSGGGGDNSADSEGNAATSENVSDPESASGQEGEEGAGTGNRDGVSESAGDEAVHEEHVMAAGEDESVEKSGGSPLTPVIAIAVVLLSGISVWLFYRLHPRRAENDSELRR
ncbi:MAG: terpene cyclase/mutase family protein [Actinobacteria bacterium]|nr:terpene cyclase/mutase family protein [Actinomycetota bacterium]